MTAALELMRYRLLSIFLCLFVSACTSYEVRDDSHDSIYKGGMGAAEAESLNVKVKRFDYDSCIHFRVKVPGRINGRHFSWIKIVGNTNDIGIPLRPVYDERGNYDASYCLPSEWHSVTKLVVVYDGTKNGESSQKSYEFSFLK